MLTRKELGIPADFPDHTQLPDSDGTFVKNCPEYPQSILLTDSFNGNAISLSSSMYC